MLHLENSARNIHHQLVKFKPIILTPVLTFSEILTYISFLQEDRERNGRTKHKDTYIIYFVAYCSGPKYCNANPQETKHKTQVPFTFA